MNFCCACVVVELNFIHNFATVLHGYVERGNYRYSHFKFKHYGRKRCKKL